MGTFGTGPFDSDGAGDFLDDLAQRPADQRHEALARMFQDVLAHPELLWREFFPDEVVAAAAIVAAGLPGGEYLLHELSEAVDDGQAVTLPAPAPDLATPALDALAFVAGPQDPWHQGWTDESSRAEAQQTTDKLFTILRGPNQTTAP